MSYNDYDTFNEYTTSVETNSQVLIILADTLIILSFLGVSIILFNFLRKKMGSKFRGHLKIFAIFILVCGIVHLAGLFHLLPTHLVLVTSKVSFSLIGVGNVLILIRVLKESLKTRNSKSLEESNFELKRLNEELRETLEAAQMGSWVVDLEANKIHWSSWVYKIHELEEGTELYLEKAINFYHPDSRPIIEEAIQRAIDNGESWDLELKLLTAKGNEIWTRAIGRPVVIDGKTVKLKGLFQDINEIKLRTQKIEENEWRLKESQTIGKFGNWSLDLEKNIRIWSDELYRMYGQEDLTNKPPQEELMRLIHPKDQIRLDKAIASSKVTRKPYDLIYRIIWPSGETRYLHERGQVFYDSKTDLALRVSGTSQDVTNRVLIERELKESEMALREAERISSTGNWKWSQSSNTHVWSDERFRILGYEPGEVKPSLKAAFDLIIEEDKERVKKAVNAALEENADYEFEYTIVTKNGQRKNLREKGRFHEVGGLFSNAYIGTVQDVTSEFERKEQLEISLKDVKRSNEELKNFAYVASHDLQEPLRVINSYLQLIEMSYASLIDDEGRQYIRNTINAATRMKNLIDDLLKLSRLETENREIEEVDIMELMSEVEEDLKIAIEESSASIIYKELPKVKGDKGQLRQLLQNLVGNSIKFRRKDAHPVVEITSQSTSQSTSQFHEFQVKDNGIGIGKDYYKRIFTIFQRLHAREEYQGTGIGLAICKKIIERHNGSISVESEVNEGSTFSFTISK